MSCACKHLIFSCGHLSLLLIILRVCINKFFLYDVVVNWKKKNNADEDDDDDDEIKSQ